jgi:hypothetical protein
MSCVVDVVVVVVQYLALSSDQITKSSQTTIKAPKGETDWPGKGIRATLAKEGRRSLCSGTASKTTFPSPCARGNMKHEEADAGGRVGRAGAAMRGGISVNLGLNTALHE